MNMNALTVLLFSSLLFLFVFIRKFWRSRDILSSGGIALGFWIASMVGGGYMSSYINSPDRVKEKIEFSLRDNPAYQAFKKTDLPTYEVMLSVLTAQAIDQKISIESPRWHKYVQYELSRQMDSYWNQADTQAIFEYVDVLLAKLRVLQERDSTVCYAYLYDAEKRGGGIDSRYFSKMLMNSETQAIAAVIYSAKQSGQAKLIPDRNAELRIFLPIMNKLDIEFGEDAQMLRTPYAEEVNPDRMCRITTRLLELTRDLPEADSSAAFGLMLAQPMRYSLFPFPYLKL